MVTTPKQAAAFPSDASNNVKEMSAGSLLDDEEDLDANRKYLDEHRLYVYLEDAGAQLLALRKENAKIKPSKFYREYFRSVQQGGHILLREFDLLCATPYNRKCVVETVCRTYRVLHTRENKLRLADYHSLLALLWPDFPISLVEKAIEILKPPSEDFANFELAFKDFLRVFHLRFCYKEFLERCEEVYGTIRLRRSMSTAAIEGNPLYNRERVVPGGGRLQSLADDTPALRRSSESAATTPPTPEDSGGIPRDLLLSALKKEYEGRPRSETSFYPVLERLTVPPHVESLRILFINLLAMDDISRTIEMLTAAQPQEVARPRLVSILSDPETAPAPSAPVPLRRAKSKSAFNLAFKSKT